MGGGSCRVVSLSYAGSASRCCAPRAKGSGAGMDSACLASHTSPTQGRNNPVGSAEHCVAQTALREKAFSWSRLGGRPGFRYILAARMQTKYASLFQKKREGAMPFKRLLQAVAAVLVLFAAAPAPAQPVLKVGSTPTGVPFTFLDTKTNSVQGIMVDLITEIGKDAGFNVQIEPMQFSTLIASLTSNKIDIISAAMFATSARKEVIDFSEPFYSY